MQTYTHIEVISPYHCYDCFRHTGMNFYNYYYYYYYYVRLNIRTILRIGPEQTGTVVNFVHVGRENFMATFHIKLQCK